MGRIGKMGHQVGLVQVTHRNCISSPATLVFGEGGEDRNMSGGAVASWTLSEDCLNITVYIAAAALLPSFDHGGLLIACQASFSQAR